MKDIAIFGFKDSLTGQLINMLDDKYKKKLNCILTINEISKINIHYALNTFKVIQNILKK